MFTQKLFKKTCLLLNLIRCLKNHLHFNVFEIHQKAKKTSRKEKNSLIGHSVRKLSLKPIFSTLCFARFSLFWMFSRLYSFINGQQDEKSVIKINHHGGKIITLENSFLTPCFLLLHNRHYYSIKNAALLHGQEAQISL